MYLASIVAGDGIAAGNYYNLALVRDTSINDNDTPTSTLASMNFIGATGTDPFASGAIVSETFDNSEHKQLSQQQISFLLHQHLHANAPASTLQFRQELRVSEVAQLKQKGRCKW